MKSAGLNRPPLRKAQFLHHLLFELRDLPADALHEIEEEVASHFDDEVEHRCELGFSEREAEHDVSRAWGSPKRWAYRYRDAFYLKSISDFGVGTGLVLLVLVGAGAFLSAHSTDMFASAAFWLATSGAMLRVLLGVIPVRWQPLTPGFVRIVRKLLRLLYFGAAVPTFSFAAALGVNLSAHTFNISVSLSHIPVKVMVYGIAAVLAILARDRMNELERALRAYRSVQLFARRWPERRAARRETLFSLVAAHPMEDDPLCYKRWQDEYIYENPWTSAD